MAIRAVDGDTNGAPALHNWIRKMGEPLYQYAFPTGYSECSGAWVNTGVFFNRINFVVTFANNQIAGTGYDPARLLSTEMIADADKSTSQLAALVVHTELSASRSRAVLDALGNQAAESQRNIVPVTAGASDANTARVRIAQIIGLLFGTSEFQRR